MTTAPTPGPALLVVDDSDDNRYTLVQRLRRLGYTDVATAVDGRDALAQLGGRVFDLVLLDVLMPELNGYEVLETMRADARLRHVPVIMISAVDQVESVVRCVELGAEDYLPKPFNPVLLRARVTTCLEKKRLRDEIVTHRDRMERELASAREIQLGVVPRDFPPATPSRPVEIYATLQPARQVGGDLYDFFWSDAQTLCFVVADVSDKGAPAALFMAHAKTLIRLVATLLRGPNGALPAPHEIIARVNEELCRDNAQAMFVTLFFGMLDPASGELRFCNAGHNAPYVVTPGGAVVPMTGTRAKPLGIRRTMPYVSDTAKLAPGDCLFVFTDGVTESMDAAGALFAEERLEATLCSLGGRAPRAVVEGVLAAVAAFAGGAPQADDIAALALRRA
jgi:sigma-B regulation protein RsbU (phosphoserine phosphatase)